MYFWDLASDFRKLSNMKFRKKLIITGRYFAIQ